MNTLIVTKIWNETKSFVRDNAVITVLLLLYIFFYRYWESLIGNHIIDKFLCHFESNLFIDLIFLAILIFSICNLVKNWGKNISKSTKYLCCIAILFWVYYRWIAPYFSPLCGLGESAYYLKFKSLSLCEGIMYIDIIPIFALCRLLPLLGIKDTFFSFENGFGTDNPIISSMDDRLNRYDDAGIIIEKILNTDTSKNAFTFGIDGAWGSGKTSFMKLMKEKINDDFSNETIVIDFNPWLYPAEKDLMSIFFDDLSKHLKKYNSALAKSIIDYSKTLSAFGTTETRLVSSMLDLTHHDSSLREKKQQIINAINHIHRKIVVFIDDLDRLDSKELMEILKLIRNSSDFPYMYFIAAYDRSYLLNCLSSVIPNKENSYLEKIFQQEIPLSEIGINISNFTRESRRIFREFFVNFVNGDDKNELSLYLDTNNQDVISLTLNNQVLTPTYILNSIREIKRLSNRFRTSYNFLKGEVNVCDLFLLELFKLRYPLVYVLFVQKKDVFLIQDDKDEDVLLFYRAKDVPAGQKKPSNKVDFIDYLENHKKQYFITDLDIELINRILDGMFPKDISKGRMFRGIQDINYIEHYLNPTNLLNRYSNRYPANRLGELISNNDDLSKIKSEICMWAHSDPKGLIHCFADCRIEDVNDIIKLLRAALYFLSLETPVTLSSIFSTLLNLSRTSTNLTEDKETIKKDIIEYGYNRVILKDLYLLREQFLTQLMGFAQKQNLLFTPDEIDDITIQLFKDCINRNANNMIEIINCFQLVLPKIRNNFIFYPEGNQTIIDEIMKIMKDHIYNHFIDFIQCVIIKTGANEYRLDNDLIVLLYSWEEVSKLINKNGSKELKDFFDKYSQNKYKKSVTFKFEQLKYSNKNGSIIKNPTKVFFIESLNQINEISKWGNMI